MLQKFTVSSFRLSNQYQQSRFATVHNFCTNATLSAPTEYIPDKPTHLRGVYNYSKARNAYRREVSKLRIAFAAEHALKVAKLKAEKTAERNRIQQEKLARLAIKKAQQEERKIKPLDELNLLQEEQKKEALECAARRAEEVAKVKQTNEKLVEKLKEDSSQWMTIDNVETKIAEDLFISTAERTPSVREPFQSEAVKAFVANLRKSKS